MKTRQGFTVIELLVAMAILLIIVMMIGQILTGSTKAWDTGTNRAQDNLAARAALDFIGRHLSQVIADDVVGLRLDTNEKNDKTYGNLLSDRLYFASLSNIPDSAKPREIQENRVYVKQAVDDVTKKVLPGRFQLRYAYRNGLDEIKSYKDPVWWESADFNYDEVILDNVAEFDVWCFGYDGTNEYYSVPDYNSLNKNYSKGMWSPADLSLTIHKLPAWIDMYVTVLQESDAIRAALLVEAGKDADALDFVIRNGKRYTLRVYPQNREGYAMGNEWNL